MASVMTPLTAARGPDTLVAVKININGSNKRFRMPIGDLGPETLPGKLRAVLNIPADTEAIFERYSDSAADFVTLDPANVQVYKQLLRAAKAKLKLRLKATIIKQKDKEPAPTPQTPAPAPAPTPAPAMSPNPFIPESMPNAPCNQLPQNLWHNAFMNPPVPGQFPTSATRPFSLPMRPNPTLPMPMHSTAAADLAALVNERWNAALDAARSISHPTTRTYGPGFCVYCNNCDASIAGEHYHCGTCDEGDYDLCTTCVDRGVLCRGAHWMIKRNVKNGSIVTSTTERLPPTTIPINDSKTTLVGEAPKQPVETEKTEKKVPVVVEQVALEPEQDEWFRTCNCCLAEDKEEGFVTCKDCADYDLCMSCITDNVHGHHASHTFEVACASHKVSEHIERLMKPGRNVAHSAICDKCDKYIFGVRHKCLDCPDWDLCNGCVDLADAIHPNHRFVPIYDSKTCARVKPESIKYFQVHTGIYCDGPLCFEKHLLRQNIEGERYKCAVCDDFDLCANCEASPLNTHNVTHPVIKFRTPVRSVIVNTTGNHDDGKPLPMMGDKVRCTRKTSSKCTGTTAVPSANASTQVQTTADMQPKVETEKEGTEKEVRAEDAKIVKEEVEEPRMEADFVRDVIQDGSVFPPNVVFEQTWYLRNTGNEYWPAGCSVKFIGGDNMCANDPDHPASVHELVSAAESTTCYSEVSPGQEHGFTVLMRSPQKAGRAISYWRLTGPDGLKFDHKLWCDITVEESDIPVQKTADVVEKDVKNEKNESEHSQLVFPALVKESPVESVHENTTESVAEAAADVPPAYEDDLDDFASVGDDHSSSDGFLTDEEYDILDASDQEFSEMN